ncbi:MAG: hypothetical protein EXR83_07355 [Gammaproteobacteria bacterium]|nr:hypothetical protein [Gammaproteobacteria bacterium]
MFCKVSTRRESPPLSALAWALAALLHLTLASAQDTAAQLASGDYAGAAKTFELGARAGEAVAQNNFGVLLLRGKGVAKDPLAARHWFELAAAQGLRGAMYNMGMLYLRGYGTPADPVTAAGWLEKSAVLGDPEAQFYLATLYFHGTGLTGNPQVAAHWFEEAAKQGLKEAKFNLALLLLEGKGVRADEARAVDLLAAIAESHPDAALVLAKVDLQYLKDPARAKHAFALFRRLAESGNAEAQAALGTLYLTGTATPTDSEEGHFWLAQAAQQGYTKGQRQLGQLYESGVGVSQDRTQAAAWYTLAAQAGDHESAERLAGLLPRLTPAAREEVAGRVVVLQQAQKISAPRTAQP